MRCVDTSCKGLLKSLIHIRIHLQILALIPAEQFDIDLLCSDKREKESVILTNRGLYSNTDCSTSAPQTDTHTFTPSHTRTEQGISTNTKK